VRAYNIRGCIKKFPDWVENEIYVCLWYYSLRSNTKGCDGKTHYVDSQNSDTTAPSDSYTICNFRSRRPVRKLLDALMYVFMHVCMRMCVCVHVCTCVYIYICIDAYFKGKVVPVLWAPGHEGVLGEWRYGSTNSWPWYLMEESGQLHSPAALHPGKEPLLLAA
jgi:hypothetical protein